MQLKLDESHELYRQNCLRFAREKIAPFAHEWEEAGLFPRELYQQAAAAGILGVSLPEGLGGAGGDMLHALVTIEALLTGGSTGVVSGLGSLGIALPPVLNLGSTEQKRRFVPPVITGEKI
ncbi:MAG TPA: acyl-CoA dehydrogenase family protein, partial [Polyangiaceae bacterium]|nr:acyl-CoA dehydrogenase family protein [Polyangiaceae bacterium]